MKTFIANQCTRVAAVAACSMLASCALPSAEAWRAIKQDGLIPYIAMELGHKPEAPKEENRYMESARPATVVAAPAPAPVAAPVTTTVASDLKTSPPRSATSNVPSPRVILNNVPVYPPSAVAKAKPEAEKPAPKVTAKADKPAAALPPPVAAKPKTETPAKPKVAVDDKPKTAPAPAPEKKAAPKQDAPPAPTTVDAKPKADAAGELPYGTPVPGRPGLVHSPYAGEKQLVDITGLKPGQEVKCPYSGKLFRVPPGAQAADTSSKEKK